MSARRLRWARLGPLLRIPRAGVTLLAVRSGGIWRLRLWGSRWGLLGLLLLCSELIGMVGIRKGLCCVGIEAFKGLVPIVVERGLGSERMTE
jgi:hypothetical protein